MRLKFWSRTDGRPAKPGRIRPADRDLWWVRVVLNLGRPLVAVTVLVMCAPGEHHLARYAGWSEELAWGMPATLTAYAGIAAVVATKRAKGAPGKRTAVLGAILSVSLAMAAQPIAHLYGFTGLDVQRVVLICVVSCIPAAVFGHLLHMAAVPGERLSVRAEDKPDSIADAHRYRGGRTDSTDNGLGQYLTDSVIQSRTPGVVPDTVPDTVPDVQWTATDTDIVFTRPPAEWTENTEVPVNRTDEPEFTTWHGSNDAMEWGGRDRTWEDGDGHRTSARTLVRNAEADNLLAVREPDIPEPDIPEPDIPEPDAADGDLAAEDVRPRVIARPAPSGVVRPVDVARRLRAVYPAMPEDELRKRIHEELPGAKLDSIRKAVSRTRPGAEA